MEDKRQGKRRQRYNGVGKAIFLLKINEIKADLQLGSRRWAYEQTWKRELQVSYAQFARYIQEFIYPGKQARKTLAKPARPVLSVVSHRSSMAPSGHPAPAQTSPRQVPRQSATQFYFDPAEAHQRDDLI